MANGVMADSSSDGSVRGKGQGSDPTKKDGKVKISTTRPGNAPSTVYMGQAAPPNVPYAVSPRPLVVDIDQAETAYTTPDSYNRFMNKEWKSWVDSLAESIDYRRTGSSLWTDAIDASQALKKQGIDVSPMQWLLDVAKERGFSGASEEQAKALKGVTASRRVSRSSDRDIRLTVDAIASEVLGRAVTDDEFQKVLSKVRGAETSEAQYGGMSSAVQKDLITESLMQGPEAEDYAKATKMMDLFYSALNARPEGA
jgi:hypothetical protein